MNFGALCWAGMTKTAATCLGGETLIPIECGFPRSCCNKRGLRRCSTITLGSSRDFRPCEALAAAREPSVLAVWSGLGYYHRARRMHQAAKVIARERKGDFPRTRGRVAGAAGDWTLHRCGHREHRLWRGGCRRGWQRRARARAACLADGEQGAAWQKAEALLDHDRPVTSTRR